MTDGSDEYKKGPKDMVLALHHYHEMNSHYPEHYEWGIHGISR